MFDLTPRGKRKFSMRNTFNIELGYKDGILVKADKMLNGFERPTEWTPALDPGYEFSLEETKALLMGIEMKDNILLTGDTGVGKTSLVEQVAARLNYNVVKINFDRSVTKQDLIGEWVVKDKNMDFQYGILVHAFQMPGTIILLDEWDAISHECAFVLQRPLERYDRRILIMEKGGELIPLHPDNVIIATANTNGQGDDTGLYSHGTSVQNYAQINRFSMTIRMKYMSEQKELQMLQKRFPVLQSGERVAFCRTISLLRDGFTRGDLSVPLSHRDLINWAEKYITSGDYMWSAKYCFLNRMSPEDALVSEQIIKRVVDAK